MKNKQIILKYLGLMIFASAFFVSCKDKDDQVGINIQTKQGLIKHTVLGDAIDLKLSGVIKSDSLLTSGSDLIHVGTYTDKYVGKVKSTSFFQIDLGADLPTSTDVTISSVYLKLAFSAITTSNRTLQGDASLINTLEIYRMTEFFEKGVSYNNDKNFLYGALPIASIAYNPLQPTEYLDIKLPNDFGDSLVKFAKGKSKEEFKNAFAGFALVGKDSDGSIVAFNLNSVQSFLQLNYSSPSLPNQNYFFDLSTSLRHHIHLESDRGNTIFSSLTKNALVSSTTTEDKLLIQNGVGASIVVNLGDLKSKLITAVGDDTIINRAVLVLPIVQGSYKVQENEPVNVLKIYEANESGDYILKEGKKSQLVPDFNFLIGGSSSYFVINEDKTAYEMDLTYYIQEYVLGKRNLNHLLITSNIILSSANFAARSNRSVIDAKKASFKIYYSTL